jgi:hypothetical protein
MGMGMWHGMRKHESTQGQTRATVLTALGDSDVEIRNPEHRWNG